MEVEIVGMGVEEEGSSEPSGRFFEYESVVSHILWLI